MSTRVRVPDGEYLKGVLDTSIRLGELMSKVTDGSPGAVADCCMDVGARAVEKAPNQTNALQGSLQMPMYVRQEGGVTVGTVKFTAEYAAAQHEHVEYHHDNGEAKYLEKAMQEKQSLLTERLAEILAKAFGG